MVTMFSGNALWHLVRQSDTVSKLVLLILLSMSILCWAVFFYKVILLKIKNKQLKKARAALRPVRSVDDLVKVVASLSDTLPGYVLSQNLVFVRSLLEKSGGALNHHQLELVQQHVEQAVDDSVHYEEAYLPILSTSAAVSPLLGLFGTVWGLVHAFIRISELQTADIAAVAPGIAEALITTLAGLVVAIPAVVMFNYVQVQVRGIEQQLFAIADSFIAIVRTLQKD